MTLRVVIIDHYDSYTNNLLQLLKGDEQANGNGNTNGACVTKPAPPQWSIAVIRFDQFSWDEFKCNVLPFLDAIILSPGPGTPDKVSDFGFNSKLIEVSPVPILGVCLGHQGIGTTFGAKIIHAPSIKHGQVCEISHTGTGIFKGVPQHFKGVRYNSLLLDINSLPDELEPTAWTFDVDTTSVSTNSQIKVLMGLQHRQRPYYSTQWHPESICSTYGKKIMDNFRDLVKEYWVSGPHAYRANQWGIALPKEILESSAIALEAQRGYAAAPANGVEKENKRPYYIASSYLGKGSEAAFVFQSLIKGFSKDGEVWLDSARARNAHSRNSYLAAGVFSITYSTRAGVIKIKQNGEEVKEERLDTSETYWGWLNEFQSSVIQNNVECLHPEKLGPQAKSGQPVFQVGLLGYFGYEMKRESLPGYGYTRPGLDGEENNVTPDSQHLFSNFVVRLDNFTGEWFAFGLIHRGIDDPIGERINAKSPIGLKITEFYDRVGSISNKCTKPLIQPNIHPKPLPQFEAVDNEKSYTKKIHAAQEYIRNGETYEVTLTTKFQSRAGDEGKLANKGKADYSDRFAHYLGLRGRNPAPYSAYMSFPGTQTTVMSSSPERFISINVDGMAEMKPIKGTIAVSSDKEEDERRKAHLATDVKELAENLMIVDLIRSDLHNISPPSSIEVPKLLKVESYETVHQLVTTIHSRPAESIGPVRVLNHCFPPGSMTGAPKLRSVRVIDELEADCGERGVYSGCLGYICASGTMDQAVVIRTVVQHGLDTPMTIGAGGAITWLSEADKEWDEVMVKVSAVADAKGRED